MLRRWMTIVLGLGVLYAVTPDPAEAQCYRCGQSTCVSSAEHQVAGGQGDDDLYTSPGGTHPCWSGGCAPPAHEVCDAEEDFEEEDLLSLTSLADQSGAELRALMARYPTRVTYNAERHAIQVLDCVGERVIGHVSLSTDQVAAVEEQQ